MQMQAALAELLEKRQLLDSEVSCLTVKIQPPFPFFFPWALRCVLITESHRAGAHPRRRPYTPRHACTRLPGE